MTQAGNTTTTTAFAVMGLSSPSMRAINEVMKFTHATAVQDQTLPPILQGLDVLARAKTGSGKTVAFLLPSIETLLKSPPAGQNAVSVLVLSPTRELASQIHEEAKSLLTFHNFQAQCVFGGTNINSERNRMNTQRCDFLVATPGRLIDHFESSQLSPRCANLKVLILDEADQLLEMGFKPAIDKILSYIPRQRQTLLFSATVPHTVKNIAANALRPGYAYVDCVGEDDSATNLQVKQWLTIAPLADHLHLLVQLISSHQKQEPMHKVICFFPTARATQLAAELFIALDRKVTEIHSRKSQGHRTKAADQFREAKSGVMMSSDVSARGLDYPDVTLVIQIGLPSSREQYIHRLGRTARAGKSGEGILLLAPHEAFFAKLVSDLPIEKINPRVNPDTAAEVGRSLAKVSMQTKNQTYAAWLGFYKPFCRSMKWSPEDLVRNANRFAVEILGCPEPPPVLRKTVGMMGLKGVPGLNIVSVLPGSDDDEGGGGGGGGLLAAHPRAGGAGDGGGEVVGHAVRLLLLELDLCHQALPELDDLRLLVYRLVVEPPALLLEAPDALPQQVLHLLRRHQLAPVLVRVARLAEQLGARRGLRAHQRALALERRRQRHHLRPRRLRCAMRDVREPEPPEARRGRVAARRDAARAAAAPEERVPSSSSSATDASTRHPLPLTKR
mmetsp:Transcript_35225/g.86427  ORF Transcript_35225/g.86427 Transcript_35225/m.86427 type:complete len:673 (+) Transcript_35225:423-2441(+)